MDQRIADTTDGSQARSDRLPLAPPGRTVVRVLHLPILTLNLADAVYTMGWVQSGLATEANPLMAWLLLVHPVSFAVTKLGLVVLGLVLLDRFRDRQVAQAAAVLLFLVYVLIFGLHLEGTEALLLAP